jgi:NAD(P)-dependent dehydrogenase (short-subunit alcohol dehydrogenase family)
MKRLEGKVALVTGAVGGIGTAIVEDFLAEGAKVILCDVKADDVLERVGELAEAGHPVFAAPANIVDAAAIRAAVDAAVATAGPIDIVVANANIGGRPATLAKTSAESWRADIGDNLAGQFNTIATAIDGMKARRSGSIVVVGSVNGLTTLGQPAYSAAKAALVSYTRTMATEYGAFNIRANIVCPGTVRTPAWAERVKNRPETFETLMKWYPLRRVAEPREVAKAITFLASDDASFITGAMLPVDGGLMAGNRLMANELTHEEL